MTATTTHKFVVDCNNHPPSITEELPSPAIAYQVADTPQCAALHTTHLFRGQHHKIHISAFSVPNDQLLTVFKWRPGRVEEIELVRISGNTSATPPIKDSVKRETRIIFEVPPQCGPTAEWIVSGGSPGFKLRVFVQRK